MSRAGSSGGGRSSLGYLFEPDEIFPIHRFKSNQEIEKPSEDNIVLQPQDDKVMAGDEADHQEPPYQAPPKREEDSNPIVSHRPASIIYHTNQSGNNSGLLITICSFPTSSSRFAHAYETEPLGGSTSLPCFHSPVTSLFFPFRAPELRPCPFIASEKVQCAQGSVPRASLHGRWSLRLHHGQLRRQEPSARRGRALPDAAFPRRPASPVLPVHADGAQARARDRHVLRPAGGPGARPGSRARAFAGGRGGVRGGAPRGGEEGAEAVREADVPGGRRHVQPRGHLHGHRLRVLPLCLANGGRRGADDRDAGHVRALRRRSGRDGVLGAVGAQGAVARVPVAHARVAPPAARRALRAQRRVRHHQRRAGHCTPHPRPLLRRGPWDYAFRDGIHVRPRWSGPPPVPRRPHRGRALLPASGCRSQDTPHGQVRGGTVWAFPGTQGAGGCWRPRRAGAGARQDQPDSEHLKDSGHGGICS